MAFNVAVLLTHTKRDEEAARAWLPARGQPLDQTADYYQRWVATLRNEASGNSADTRQPAESNYREMDRVLGEAWRNRQRMQEQLDSLDSLHDAIDYDAYS